MRTELREWIAVSVLVAVLVVAGFCAGRRVGFSAGFSEGKKDMKEAYRAGYEASRKELTFQVNVTQKHQERIEYLQQALATHQCK